MQDTLPHTDSRLRPDVRILEQGNIGTLTHCCGWVGIGLDGWMVGWLVSLSVGGLLVLFGGGRLAE